MLELIRATDPAKYALAILTAHFFNEEMGQSCHAKIGQSTKPSLPVDKTTFLEGIETT